MKKILCMLVLSICVFQGKIDAFSILKDAIYYPKLMQQKNQVIPKITKDLFSPEEERLYRVESDRITNIDCGRIEYIFTRDIGKKNVKVTKKYGGHTLELMNKEGIYIRIFHTDAYKKEPNYTSAIDCLERFEKKRIQNQNDEEEEKREILRSSQNDVVYILTEWDKRLETCQTSQVIGRMVFHQGRIYHVFHGLGLSEYTPEEKEKWISRLENLSYLNQLASLSNSISTSQTNQNQTLTSQIKQQ